MATYKVQSGDTLWGIAQKVLGNGANWRQLGYTGDPTKLQVGTVLNLPDSSSGGGSPSTPASTAGSSVTTPSGGGSPAADYASALSTAETMVPQVDTSGLETIASNLASIAQQKSESLTAQITPTQNLYSALADRLQKQEETQITATQKEESMAVGGQQVATAAAGGVPGTGFNAALESSIKQDYDNKVQQITDNYGINSEQLVAQESKDVATLQTEAVDALAQGQRDVADITSKIISVKQQQDTMTREIASAILNAQTKEEQMILTAQYRDATLALRSQSLDLSAQRLQLALGSDMTDKDLAAAADQIQSANATLSNFPARYRAAIVSKMEGSSGGDSSSNTTSGGDSSSGPDVSPGAFFSDIASSVGNFFKGIGL